MKIALYLYGSIIIFEGVFLLFSEYFTFITIKFALGIALLIGAILAFFTAFTRKRKHVQFAYHALHALAMLVNGIAILLFVNTMETLSYLTAFLLLFYAISEIAFCNWLFNLKNEVKSKILVVRVLLGLSVGIATAVLMNFYTVNFSIVLRGFGILFTIIGFNILLYEPIMKTKTSNEP